MHILFDLDGTLTDPKTGILNSIRYALDELGYDSPPEHQLHSCIGPPLHQSFRELLDTDHPDLIGEAVAAYRVHFASKGLYENILYDGIPEALEGLRSAGATLYLATSKPTVYAARIIEHFGLGEFFHALYGSEMDGTRGDKEELIAHILKRENLPAAKSRMVGDRKHDAIGAIANGVIPFGVLWGYGSQEELRAAGCAALYGEPGELFDILSTIPQDESV